MKKGSNKKGLSEFGNGIVTGFLNETRKTIVTKYVIELICMIVTTMGNGTHDEMVTCSSD